MRWIARLVAAGLLLSTWATAGAQSAPMPQLIPTRQTSFYVPFRVAPAPAGSPREPVEVQLHVSYDRGQRWELYDKVPPADARFTFTAPHDGEFWFLVRTLTRAGTLEPQTAPAPELRVQVDTEPPQIELSAVRGDAGEVRAGWRVQDPTLRPDSFAIQYQPAAGADSWQRVATDPPQTDNRGAYFGHVTWWPEGVDGPLTVRIEVVDAAGNKGTAETTVAGRSAPQPEATREPSTAPALVAPQGLPLAPASPDDPLGSAAAGQPAPLPADAVLNEARRSPQPEPQQPAPAVTSQGDAWSAWQPPPAGPVRNPFNYEPPPRMPTHFPGQGGTAPHHPTATPQGEMLPPARPSGPSSFQSIQALSPGAGRGAPAGELVAPGKPSLPGGPSFASRRESLSDEEVISGPSLGVLAPRGEEAIRPGRPAPAMTNVSESEELLPPGIKPQMVNSRRFELEYDVDSVGPAGIAQVELWVTRDGGRNWESFGFDDDNRSPFVVTVPDEGIYGFRIIVESSSGLRGSQPRPGDLPEVWVGVDLTRPEAEFTAIEQGTGDHGGELAIRWRATDQLLAARPISLSFSEGPGRGWTTIAAGLPNTGVYYWRLDNRVPDEVYLRLEVRDEAGNLQEVVANQPVSLSRIRPQGRIRSVRPLSEARQIGAGTTLR